MNALRPRCLFLAASLFMVFRALAQDDMQRMDFTVDGVAREALIHVPTSAKTTPAPLVFVFHGHGGSARNAARSFALDRAWPEAISVYMQGLNTPGRLTDPEGKKSGWQERAGVLGDRDLKCFDAVLARLKANYQVDAKRIYATGHSNGGQFTYLLWAERGDTFAGVAPSAGFSVMSIAKLKPKPAMHIAGSADPLVKFAWQQRVMESVRKIEGSAPEGTTWAKDCTLYESKSGAAFVAFIHPGGHNFPAEAPALIVKFFKEHPATTQ